METLWTTFNILDLEACLLVWEDLDLGECHLAWVDLVECLQAWVDLAECLLEWVDLEDPVVHDKWDREDLLVDLWEGLEDQ